MGCKISELVINIERIDDREILVVGGRRRGRRGKRRGCRRKCKEEKEVNVRDLFQ